MIITNDLPKMDDAAQHYASSTKSDVIICYGGHDLGCTLPLLSDISRHASSDSCVVFAGGIHGDRAAVTATAASLQRYKRFTVVVPHCLCGPATLLALSATDVCVARHAQLGHVDARGGCWTMGAMTLLGEQEWCPEPGVDETLRYLLRRRYGENKTDAANAIYSMMLGVLVGEPFRIKDWPNYFNLKVRPVDQEMMKVIAELPLLDECILPTVGFYPSCSKTSCTATVSSNLENGRG